MSAPDEAGELVRLYDGLQKQRDVFRRTWEFARWFLLPNRVDDVRSRPSDFVGRVRNGTAKMACARLAGGHMSHIVPSHEPWFKWCVSPGAIELEEGEDEEDAKVKEEEANAWYARCSEIALAELTCSNFYTEVHECFLDRVAFGTGGLYCGPGRGKRLLFKWIAPEQFCGELDEEGRVVVFVREMCLSAYDVADLFGKGALGEGMREEFKRGGAAMYDKKWVVLHVVRRAKVPKMGGGWEGFYVDAKEKRVMKREREWEMPYMATRWKMNGSSFWGFASWLYVAGEIEEVEQIERVLDRARRVAVDPRILQLASQVGEVDFRAGGRTIISPEALDLGGGGVFPRVWAEPGDVGLAYKQLADKEAKIEEAFCVPMLELFAFDSERKGFPTATEVMARENERLLQFFPSFVQFVYDFQPLLERVFMVLYRAGAFPEPPAFIKVPVMRNGVQVGVALRNPGVTYNNKVALVLKRIESDAFVASLREAAELGQVVPGLLDHFDGDYGMRARARSLGVSERMLRPQVDVDELRESQVAKSQEQGDLMRRQAAASASKDEAAAAKLAVDAQGGV